MVLSRISFSKIITSIKGYFMLESILVQKRFVVHLVLATCLTCFLVITYFYTASTNGFMSIDKEPSTGKNLDVRLTEEDEMFERSEYHLINQPGCRIPKMTVFGPLIDPFLPKNPPPVARCAYGSDGKGGANWKEDAPLKPAIVIDDEISLTIDRQILAQYYNNISVTCKYRSFRRTLDFLDDFSIEYSNVTRLLKNDQPTIVTSEEDEFVLVECWNTTESLKNKNGSIDVKPFYRDCFAFTPLKKMVENRCNKINRVLSQDRVNVLLMGLDAVSRLNFHRQFPDSYKYLMNELKAIEMLGYNKLGDNTFPNILALLTNVLENELSNYCQNYNVTFEECPFIWDVFRFYGYRTIFAEDCNSRSGIFHFSFSGFRRQPTDYYLHAFYVAAEREIAFNRVGECNLCLGNRISMKVLLNYAIKHLRTWKRDQNFFGFFFTTCYTHDNFTLNPEGDASVLKFLENFHGSRARNDTILIVYSDHGMRYGEFRGSYQGHLEERLPMCFFVFPEWFKRKYKLAVRNLRFNQDKLTTHLDLHDTLYDLATLSRISDEEIVKRQRDILLTRSQSLFLAVSGDRTCQTSGIPKEYCTCHDNIQELDKNDTRSVFAAKVLTQHINDLIANKSECAKLALDEIRRVTMSSSTMGGRKSAVSHLVATVQLTPGKGLFEGTMEYDDDLKRYTVVGEVSRTNMYGSQSACVKYDRKLRLYCYCI